MDVSFPCAGFMRRGVTQSGRRKGAGPLLQQQSPPVNDLRFGLGMRPAQHRFLRGLGLIMAGLSLSCVASKTEHSVLPKGLEKVKAPITAKLQPVHTVKAANLPMLRPEMINTSILIDPGHGKEGMGEHSGDSGAKHIGRNGKMVYESELNLSVAKRVREKLKSAGLKKLDMTRDQETFMTPDQRKKLIYIKKKSDLVLSIHTNCTEQKDTQTHGFQVYLRRPLDSTLYARHMREALREEFGAKLDMGRFQRNFYMIDQPAILVEMGFINNNFDRRNLVDPKWQDRMATAISKGIIHYLNEKAYISHGGAKPAVSLWPSTQVLLKQTESHPKG